MPRLESAETGVGSSSPRQDPHPVPLMGGTNGASRYAVPLRIIPERGQVPKNGAEPCGESKSVCGDTQVPSTRRAISPGLGAAPAAFAEAELASGRAERGDVLDDDPFRADLADEARELRPETRSFASEPSAAAGERDVLAREAAANDVDATVAASKPLSIEGSNIVVNFHVGPVTAEDAAPGLERFAEGDGPEGAGPFEAQRYAADPAEQVEYAESVALILQRPPRHQPDGLGATQRTSAARRSIAILPAIARWRRT